VRPVPRQAAEGVRAQVVLTATKERRLVALILKTFRLLISVPSGSIVIDMRAASERAAVVPSHGVLPKCADPPSGSRAK
jgi:hypothetical protein